MKSKIRLSCIIQGIFFISLFSMTGEIFATEEIKLPEPGKKGNISLEEAISKRRSTRDFSEREISREQVSQLLWACQGITDPTRGFRSAPSAGALYPLEIYFVNKEGLYHYLPQKHSIINLQKGDLRSSLRGACLGQASVGRAPCIFIITAVLERTEIKYRDRASRYVHIEVGHAAQNLLLQAVSMGLGGLTVGAFEDDKVQRTLSLPREHRPLYVLPIGYPR